MICDICPRNCGIERDFNPEASNSRFGVCDVPDARSGGGYCGASNGVHVARSALHHWEEPCISGSNGSGTVFFSGCALRCVYCQNHEISRGGVGRIVTVPQLGQLFDELERAGAHNINLVTPSHYTPQIRAALTQFPPGIPVAWNSSAYEKTATLQSLDGLVQIYMPDFKYALGDVAKRYSNAPDYPHTAQAAIREMVRQVGAYRLDDDGILQRGVIIRHLILPENLENTFAAIDWVAQSFAPGEVLFSLMSQFTPASQLAKFPELQRQIDMHEYEAVMAHLENSGICDGFFQDPPGDEASYIPDWDL